MQVVPQDDAKLIFFRGKGFFISEEDFLNMVRMRKDRIDSGRYFIPDGVTVQDHFASNGIELVAGGEVCPIEMSNMVGPMSGGASDLKKLFGEFWFLYDDWKHDG